MNALMAVRWRVVALAAVVAVTLGGCESMGVSQMGKRIDYKSAGAGPALELPPDLTKPQYDDRYAVTSASELAAKNASRPKQSDLLPVNTGDVRIGRAGSERWLVVKATPEQAWSNVRKFWVDNGFVIATEQPALGVMETDWAENRAEIPQDVFRKYIGKYIDVFYSTYKRDKFRTRLERGVEAGTMDIYVSQRRMEQVPTVMIDKVSPAGFAWAVMPPSPSIEAEFLTRLMVKFGVPEVRAAAAVQQATSASPANDRARIEKSPDGSPRLYVDDSFDRAWRRVGLALDRVGFTVVDRDRSKGVYFVRYADPDQTKKDDSFISKLMLWKDKGEKPEQYRIFIADSPPPAVVTVQDPNGAPDKTPNSEKILALLKDQLK